MASSIGQFLFLALEGHPVPPTEQSELVMRPGVGGVGVWRTGVRGEPFRMVSSVDMPNIEIAEAMAGQYTTLAGQDPIDLIQDGVAFDYKVVVLRVMRTRWHAHVIAVGGLYPPSLAFLSAEWLLVAIGDEGVHS